MPDDICTVKYKDLDYAVMCSLKLWEASGCKSPIFYSKSDLKSAFRIIPCWPMDFPLLLLKAKHPVTGHTFYFLDKNLPFGASISCSLFQLFSDSLQHITQFLIGRCFSLVNYLDDYLFIAESERVCNEMVRTFLEMCSSIGCPVSMEKTEWASTKLIFLGILLNGGSLTLAVPDDKRIKADKLLQWAIEKRKVTIHFVQKLTGTLNFLNKAIVPGRAFTRKMYQKLTITDNCGRKLKQFHHINLDKEFIQDCMAWREFLKNQVSAKLCRPFLDWKRFETLVTLNFYSDASASKKKGMGAIFGNHYIFKQWNKSFITELKPSIQFLELYALVAAVVTWGERLQNMSFHFL